MDTYRAGKLTSTEVVVIHRAMKNQAKVCVEGKQVRLLQLNTQTLVVAVVDLEAPADAKPRELPAGTEITVTYWT